MAAQDRLRVEVLRHNLSLAPMRVEAVAGSTQGVQPQPVATVEVQPFLHGSVASLLSLQAALLGPTGMRALVFSVLTALAAAAAAGPAQQLAAMVARVPTTAVVAVAAVRPATATTLALVALVAAAFAS